MSEPSGLDPADWAMWREVVAMRASVERALEQRLQHDAGLSTADFDVLHSLSGAPEHRLRAGALADALGWEKSRISHQVRRMSERGLLARTACPTDARGTWVVMAAAGADALARASCGYTEVLDAAVFSRLDRDQKRTLASAAATIRAAGVLAPNAQPASAV